MGLIPYVTIMSVILLLVTLPELALSGCIFGPDKADQLLLRNGTIAYIMNETLLNYTRDIDQTIQPLSIWGYLNSTFSLTQANYLEYASMGKLLTINWAAALNLNAVVVNLIVGNIATYFTNPLHAQLQATAVKYSFSLGIFRPKQQQFNFTGITTNYTTTSNYSTLESCSAGSNFLWRLETDLDYSSTFNNSQSTQFATIATMFENAFNEYYRRNTSELNKEFIRANVLYANASNNKLIAYMEAYFHNNTFQSAYISSLTSVDDLPEMTFNNGTNDKRTVTIINDSNNTYIISVSHPPAGIIKPPSTEVPNTTSTSGTTVPAPVTTTTSTTDITFSTPGVPTTPSVITAGVTTISSNNLKISSPANTDPQTGYSTNSLNQSLPSSANTSTPSISNSGLTQTTFVPSPSGALNSSSSVFNPSAASSSTTNLPSLSNSSQTTSPSQISANLTTANSNSSLLSTNSSKTGTLSGQTGSTGSMLNQTGINGSTSHQTGTISGSVGGGTTFDPDPLFKGDVPVITKVYNDEYLLKRKIGSMAPLMENAAFLSVTIPAAIGIIAVVILCIFCWQIDCLSGRNKA